MAPRAALLAAAAGAAAAKVKGRGKDGASGTFLTGGRDDCTLPDPQDAPLAKCRPKDRARAPDAGFSPQEASLEAVAAHNGAARGGVGAWVRCRDWRSVHRGGYSLFNYGLPPQVVNDINVKTPGVVQYDVISWLAARLGGAVRYLEIGVSVGKGLFTQLSFLSGIPGSEVVAFDVEDINPTFERLLRCRHNTATVRWKEEELPANRTSLRRAPAAAARHPVDTVKQYRAKSGTRLHYLASDEDNAVAWRQLDTVRSSIGGGFNAVFSDALHEPAAIVREAKKLLRVVDLKADFFVVWDDCDGPTRRTWSNTIVPLFRDATAPRPLRSRVLMIDAWLGSREPKHPTCVVTTLNLDALRKRDAAFRALREAPKRIGGGGRSAKKKKGEYR